MLGLAIVFGSGNGLTIVPLKSLVQSLKGMGLSILLLKIAQKNINDELCHGVAIEYLGAVG